MNRPFAIAAFLAAGIASASAQPGPTPGPGPIASPWVQSGSALSWGGCLKLPSTVTGGCMGNGTINLGGAGVYHNGVLVGQPGGSSGQVQTNNGSGAFAGITNTALTALINPATASLKGALPAWPGNTTTYFRGDGTYVTLNCAALTTPCLTANQTITLSGDVIGSGATAITTTLTNIPSGVPMAGSVVAANTAAPASPSAANVALYADSTDLRFHDKNASGVIGTTVVADTGAANNFLTAIGAAGAITKAQPAFSNLSGQIAAGQIASAAIAYAKIQNVAASSLVGNPTGSGAAPSDISIGATLAFSGASLQTAAHTGDVTTSANSFATTIAASAVTYSKIQNIGASRLLGNSTGAPAAANEIILGATLSFPGAGLIQTVAGTGDVTWGANSFATTIAANAVSYAKLQQVAASSLVGNATGSLANATGITLGATFAFSGSALQTVAHTGDVTSSANSFATTVAKINGATLGTTTATSGNLLIGSGSVWATQPVSGDGALASSGALTITKTNGVAFAPVATSGSASDLSTGTLPTAQLPAGVDANVLNAKTANYTIANTDCGKTIQAGTGATGFFTITLPSVSGFATTCKVRVFDADTGRGKGLSGFPTYTNPILWPLQLVEVQIVNGAWVTSINPGRWRLPVASLPIVLSVTAGGSDANNDCLASGAANACATIQGAFQAAFKYFDLPAGQAGIVVSVKPDAGTYTAQVHLAGKFVGQDGNAAVSLDCANGVTISTTSQDAIQLFNGAVLELRGGCAIVTTTSGNGIASYATGSKFIINGNITVGPIVGAAFYAENNSSILCVPGITVTVADGGGELFLANNMGLINCASVTASFSKNMTFTQTAQAQLNSWLSLAGVTWTLNAHTITAKCHVAQYNGIIETDGATLSYCSAASGVPGSSTVTVNNQGIYF